MIQLIAPDCYDEFADELHVAHRRCIESAAPDRLGTQVNSCRISAPETASWKLRSAWRRRTCWLFSGISRTAARHGNAASSNGDIVDDADCCSAKNCNTFAHRRGHQNTAALCP
ncbi:hypothetical protein NKI59_21660 [Mesorhizobium sp. M0598]|uniref:hypothetical protein n=1 Tax=Mesorhizobium sp. M0598 TaxID=2956968 RepID=UPI00333729B3